MKIGIVGCGMVGSTAAYAMVMGGVGREIVLVDRDDTRSRAEANDISHAVPFASPLKVTAGSYADLKGSRAVIIAAGVGQKPGETRLQLLQRNASVFSEIIPEVLKRAPEAILIIATNPVDVMTHLAVHFAREHGVPAGRVFGSGTMLDTARFRALLGNHLGVDPHYVHGYVLGEHGDSEVLTWSLVTIGGMPLTEFCKSRHAHLGSAERGAIDEQVRRAAYSIIEGKGATYFGIGSALARIMNVILNNQRAILTVSSANPVSWGGKVTYSLPSLVGGKGILATFPPVLTGDETRALEASARVIGTAVGELGIPSAE
jgi:L-lactate dehydrogenase